jgi:hypothetical protein
MRALVVYESMFGNTAEVAQEIAAGLASHGEVEVVDVGLAPAEPDEGYDLIVVGGPTHAFSMTRPATREDARSRGASAGSVDRGIREWLGGLPAARHHARVALFDTRVGKVRRLPGSAARRAARVAHGLGYPSAAAPESFYVEDVAGPLLPGEQRRAREWGRALH